MVVDTHFFDRINLMLKETRHKFSCIRAYGKNTKLTESNLRLTMKYQGIRSDTLRKRRRNGLESSKTSMQ